MGEYRGIERRKYVRLKSVFPVEFRLISPDGRSILSDFQQAFTADVSKGGMLLQVNNIDAEISSQLEERKVKISLYIHIPLREKPVEATARVAWMTVVKKNGRESALIGISFEEISNCDKKRLVGYTYSLYRTPKLVAIALCLMLVAVSLDKVEEIRLRQERMILTGKLMEILRKKSNIVEWLNDLGVEKASLLAKIKKQDEEMKKLQGEWKELLRKEGEWKATIKDYNVLKEKLERSRNMEIVLETQLSRLSQERSELQKKLNGMLKIEDARHRLLEKIEQSRLRIEKLTADNMYNWLKVHQNKKTGLIASFEGDRRLKNTAFIYDQSLAAQVFLLFDDIKSAKAILDFFKYKAKRYNSAFTNAYDVSNGSITEYIVHTGPNIWIGIALMQYMEKTRSNEYLELAIEIGDWVIALQQEDPDGGIRGGPGINWFSTEHNLDAYAFLNMLAKKTGSYKYKKAAEKCLEWIKDNVYSGQEGRIYRGKGDSTIATDTFAWAIAAIGPKRLIEVGMDPDGIMEFAEENCKVQVDFVRPDGSITKVTGFDFAKYKHLPRGGVISTEWTAQMIVSFKIMRDFYLMIGDSKKAKFYQDKANFYLSELEKMVIASPSRSGQGAGCLPYATQDDVDTGHGWRTPRGRDTGSVSGTSYAIFAIKGYNPLELKNKFIK